MKKIKKLTINKEVNIFSKSNQLQHCMNNQILKKLSKYHLSQQKTKNWSKKIKCWNCKFSRFTKFWRKKINASVKKINTFPRLSNNCKYCRIKFWITTRKSKNHSWKVKIHRDVPNTIKLGETQVFKNVLRWMLKMSRDWKKEVKEWAFKMKW